MKLSIVIPSYNEERTITQIIEKVKSAPLSIEKEIIVVDNSSKDNTPSILKNITGIKIIRLDPNRGKGGALKAGIKEATGDIVIFQDADLEYDPIDYLEVIKPILDGRAHVVNGVRKENKMKEDKQIFVGFFAWLGNFAITWTTNILYGVYHKEYEGCYKAFKTEILKSIMVNTNDFDFDNELICKIIKNGYKVVDVPIHYYPRSYEEGKHINWKHGFKILWTVIKYRFIS